MGELPEEPALRAYEQLRARQVAEARAALVAAERACALRAEVEQSARDASARSEQALVQARSAFAASCTVAMMRQGETLLATRAREHAEALARAEHARLRRLDAERAVTLCASALREAERARRAVAQRLARRAHAVSRGTELREEEERDEAFRTRGLRNADR